jgi:hypothetical protein
LLERKEKLVLNFNCDTNNVNKIKSIAFNYDNDFLATGSEGEGSENNLNIWNLNLTEK